MQERLTRMSEASLRINDSLELNEVLQMALDSARSLTGAPYGVMTTLDEAGQVEDFLASGLTPEEAEQLWSMPGGQDLFQYLETIPGPMRVSSFAEHARRMGLPEFRPPTLMSSFLTAPMIHRGDRVGNINMAKRETGQDFSREDEETLVMFASQAALVIANARRYRDEQNARMALETLVDTSPVGVVVFDATTGAPLSFNREATRIVESLLTTNQPPEQLLEVMTVRRADGRDVSLLEWPLAQALSAGEAVRAEEILLSVPDGPSVTTLLNATPIRGKDGELASFVITLQDMTPLKDLERLRAEFLGMVSHELRTPLTSIKGSASTMLDAAPDLAPAELRQFLRIIVEQADNMRELIDDLLDVARIETGTLPVNAEPVEVGRLIDRARNTFLSAGGRSNLVIDIEPGLPMVMADRRRIVQVISNLLSNASRHSPESSEIRVDAKLDGLHVAISVSDEGRGIPAERLPRLFRKFSPADTRDPGGGLGLAISRGIVEAQGGRIWAESDGPRLGARFIFTVPAAEETAAKVDPLTALTREPEAGYAPVLVVDDDPQTLIQVRNTLTQAGYEPIVTADPEEALQLMAENRPRLALLDVMLPGCDGIELMSNLFDISNVPVVFLSAYGQDETIARAFEAGASDYIVKPFTPTELVARVRAALLRVDEGTRAETSAPYRLGDLAIDYATRVVTLAGEPLKLTAKEYDLLQALSVNAGRVLSHDQLLRRLWGPGKRGNIQALRTHLRRLRQKLGESASNPTYISAEPRVGYRMREGERS